jgi:hypothetical protein
MKARWLSFVAAALTAFVGSSMAAAQQAAPSSPQIATILPGIPAPTVGYLPISTPVLGEVCPGHAPADASAARQDAFVPYMLGDFASPVANMFSDVKIAEGESPRPVDRVFAKFNYYNNLAKDQWTDPTQPIHNVNLYRYTVGMEKTFFDQSMSVGLRIPFYTLDAEAKEFVVVPATNPKVINQLKQNLQNELGAGLANNPILGQFVNQLVSPLLAPSAGKPAMVVPGGPAINTTQFGNISAIIKGVVWEDRDTGSLISGGVTMSLPTASSKLINPGQSVLAYVQPYAGFILRDGKLFAQGFSSITMPIAHAESDVLFNDVGVGYDLYRSDARSSFLTAVTPTLEVHVTTPLHQADPSVNNFGVFDNLKIHNDVDFTLGATFEFCGRATLAVGVSVPVTGIRPYDVEGIAQFNYRF